MRSDYKIYIIKNIINGKIYIGKTKNIEKRFKGHIKEAINKTNRRLYDSMNCHGYENFKISIIDYADNNEDANLKEIYYIKLYDSNNDKIGYNMTKGGDGGHTRYHHGKSPYYWWVKKYGKEKADEIKKDVYKRISKKLSDKYKGVSLEERFGKETAQLMKKRISDTHKNKGIKPPVQYWTNGDHPMLNKKHTDESKEKMSKFRLGKSYEEIYGEEIAKILKEKKSKNWTGKNNPNYRAPLTKEEKIFLLKELKNKTKLSEISKKMNRSYNEMKNYWKSLGITNIQKFKSYNNFKEILDNHIKNEMNE